MFNIAVIVIISGCLLTIIFIIARKFSLLANLDVQNLQEEKESLKKREIIAQRLVENHREWEKTWRRRLEPIRKLWGQLQLRFRIYMGKVERLWYHEAALKKKEIKDEKSAPERKQELMAVLQEAEQRLLAGDLEKAEELFIAAVKIDAKSLTAYRGLSETYIAKESFEEAEETLRFILRLNPEDDGALVKLGEVAEKKGRPEEAIGYYERALLINPALSSRFYHLAELLFKIKQPEVAREAIKQALAIEPKNPRYLDLLIEVAIICGDKAEAQGGYEELRMVNPDNQKLEDFKLRIGRL